MTRVQVIAAVCAAVAIVLALPSLADASLWLDETFSVYDAQRSVADIFAMRNEAYGGAHHPPGYFLVLKATMAVCGTHEACVRMPSVLANAGVAALVVVLGARLFGIAAAAVAGGAWAVMPYAIKYAQQARHYTLLALVCAVALLAVVSALDRKADAPLSDRRAAAVGLACSGALWVHLFALPFLAALVLVAVVCLAAAGRRVARPTPRAWAIALGTAVVASSPLLPGLWQVWITDGGGQLGSRSGPVENAKALAIDLATFGLDVPWIPAIAAAALVAVGARARVAAAGLVALAGLPLVVVLVRNPEHFVALRYFMPSLVALALLFGAGAVAIATRVSAMTARLAPRMSPRIGMVLGIVVVAAAAVPIARAGVPAMRKQWKTAGFEPWRDTSAAIAAAAGEGDLVVGVPWELVRYPLLVYPPGAAIVGPDQLDVALAERPPSVFVVASHVERPERQAERRKALRRVAAAGYVRADLEGVPPQRAIEVLRYRRRDAGAP